VGVISGGREEREKIKGRKRLKKILMHFLIPYATEIGRRGGGESGDCPQKAKKSFVFIASASRLKEEGENAVGFFPMSWRGKGKEKKVVETNGGSMKSREIMLGVSGKGEKEGK